MQTEFLINKKQALWDWCKRKKEFNSVDIAHWGLSNYYLCASRMCRLFAEQGKLRRLTREEKLLRGEKNPAIAYYQVKYTLKDFEPLIKKIRES